jgi:hypothetical protein
MLRLLLIFKKLTASKKPPAFYGGRAANIGELTEIQKNTLKKLNLRVRIRFAL